MSRNQAGAAEPVKTLGSWARLSFQNTAHNPGQLRIPYQQNQNPAKMVPIKRLVSGGLLLKRVEGQLAPDQLVESAANEVRVSAQQPAKAGQLVVGLQRITITTVQFRHLCLGKILQPKPRTYVERGLVNVRYEQVRFRGIGDTNRQIRPGSGRV